jgi:hypothetical protein
MTNEASATVAMLPASTNKIPTGITAMANLSTIRRARRADEQEHINGGTISNTVVGRLDLISTPGAGMGDGYLNFWWAAPQSGLDPEGKGSGLRFYDGNTNAFRDADMERGGPLSSDAMGNEYGRWTV